MAQRRLSQPEPVEPPLRPRLADQPSRFVLLEREVELEYRPQMLEALQRKLSTVAEEARATVPGVRILFGPRFALGRTNFIESVQSEAAGGICYSYRSATTGSTLD